MCHNLRHGRPVRRVILHHAGKQLLQLRRVRPRPLWQLRAVRLPKQVGPILGNELKERIVKLGVREWWVACHHDEQYDGSREEVDLPAPVRLALMNLWRHVIFSSFVSCQKAVSLASFDWRREAKICYFQIKMLI